MIVDIDIGNTRAKWRLSSHGEIVQCGVMDSQSQDWSALSALRTYQPRRVRVSNVAGEAVAQRVRGLAGESFNIEAEFALACESVGRVRSGYQEPERLGVDRWLTILAAWDLFGNRCVVIDAGSALTVDFVDDRGHHLGGYILPGKRMMLAALFGGTSGVRVNTAQVPSSDYGKNTDAAVHNGCFTMTLALIEKVMHQDSEVEGWKNIALTGGDAESLLAHLPDTVVHRPDLVLDGLALALP
ncbi:MAG: type III pantothenate kinase [Gammaproteobacteria bacterium]|nr:type III pantothenate kinase [Gammaproteobacteria bacterium]MBQ0841012.1 type III pantothenate kinase [Gammaproteobacteria bacterium]